ncbi:hypothetical protein AB7W24_12570 [Providencia rettgeri]|uniref:hypothetical protein n=1 Tax=Providencia TaxID=586 RepID=UPI0012B5CC1A|nr:hypothetical protein [Providencia sp. wls1950]MTB46037.1 hypothetical protein [Providencia sp. wls1950]
MRKYLPLLPTLVIIIYSVIAFFDSYGGGYISAVIVNTCISVYGFKLFFTLSPFLSNKDFEFELKGIEKAMLPFNESVYTTQIALTIVAIFSLLVSGQWFVVPLFACLFLWQIKLRTEILNRAEAGNK